MLKPVEEVLGVMESIAVIKVAIGVRRTELMKISQDHNETFRTFAARVRGKAETCNFTTKCRCSADVSYTEESKKDVILAGISDIDIRREVLRF